MTPEEYQESLLSELDRLDLKSLATLLENEEWSLIMENDEHNTIDCISANEFVKKFERKKEAKSKHYGPDLMRKH